MTSVTRLPASSRRSVCTTIVVLPTCSGVDVPCTVPCVTGRKKLVFDSMVDVIAPGGRFRNAQTAEAVGQRHQRAAVDHAGVVIVVRSYSAKISTSGRPAQLRLESLLRLALRVELRELVGGVCVGVAELELDPRDDELARLGTTGDELVAAGLGAVIP